MIITAKTTMVSELKSLWKLCFHDEDTYINFYYENRFRVEETLVYLVENQVVAMLTLMPGFVVHKEEELPVRYVYAVATHPEHRRKGYAAALIEYANQTREKDYVGTFLVPACEPLFPYYQALGYHTVSYKNVFNINMEDFYSKFKQVDKKQEVESIIPLTSKDFSKLRTRAYSEYGFVRWEQEELGYILNEFLFLGGQALKIMLKKEGEDLLYKEKEDLYEEGTLLYYEDNKNLVIKETTLSDAGLYTVVRYLNSQNKWNHITVILSPQSVLEAEASPFAMAYAKGFTGGEYVNLVLD